MAEERGDERLDGGDAGADGGDVDLDVGPFVAVDGVPGDVAVEEGGVEGGDADDGADYGAGVCVSLGFEEGNNSKIDSGGGRGAYNPPSRNKPDTFNFFSSASFEEDQIITTGRLMTKTSIIMFMMAFPR